MAKEPKLTKAQEAFVNATAPQPGDGTRTPGRVLKAFYPSNLDIGGGIQVSKCGLGILLILEEIKHPFMEMARSDKEIEVSIADVSVAIFVFAEPRAARDAHAQNKLTEAAREWAMEKEIPADVVAKAPFILAGLIKGSMEMAPGVDPAATGSGGSDPLPTAQPAPQG